jgi:hypothetical protein
MSESLVLWLLGGQTALILLLAGWLIVHERACAARWIRLMEEHGELKARLYK